jgi:hypothetical protein
MLGQLVYAYIKLPVLNGNRSDELGSDYTYLVKTCLNYFWKWRLGKSYSSYVAYGLWRPISFQMVSEALWFSPSIVYLMSLTSIRCVVSYWNGLAVTISLICQRLAEKLWYISCAQICLHRHNSIHHLSRRRLQAAHPRWCMPPGSLRHVTWCRLPNTASFTSHNRCIITFQCRQRTFRLRLSRIIKWHQTHSRQCVRTWPPGQRRQVHRWCPKSVRQWRFEVARFISTPRRSSRSYEWAAYITDQPDSSLLGHRFRLTDQVQPFLLWIHRSVSMNYFERCGYDQRVMWNCLDQTRFKAFTDKGHQGYVATVTGQVTAQ